MPGRTRSSCRLPPRFRPEKSSRTTTSKLWKTSRQKRKNSRTMCEKAAHDRRQLEYSGRDHRRAGVSLLPSDLQPALGAGATHRDHAARAQPSGPDSSVFDRVVRLAEADHDDADLREDRIDRRGSAKGWIDCMTDQQLEGIAAQALGLARRDKEQGQFNFLLATWGGRPRPVSDEKARGGHHPDARRGLAESTGGPEEHASSDR